MYKTAGVGREIEPRGLKSGGEIEEHYFKVTGSQAHAMNASIHWEKSECTDRSTPSRWNIQCMGWRPVAAANRLPLNFREPSPPLPLT